jgi:hypothetical protein
MLTLFTDRDDERFNLNQLTSTQKFDSNWHRPEQLADLIDDLEYVNDSEDFSDFEEDYFWHDYGRVVSVIDGIATVYGLKRIKAGHMVTFFNSLLVSGHSQLEMSAEEVDEWLDNLYSSVDQAFDTDNVNLVETDNETTESFEETSSENLDSYISGWGIALKLYFRLGYSIKFGKRFCWSCSTRF